VQFVVVSTPLPNAPFFCITSQKECCKISVKLLVLADCVAEMNMSFSTDNESWRKALEEAGSKKVAFVYHLKIKDLNGYEKWLTKSRHNGKRLYRVKADPVAREGMLLDEIVIDEFSSVKEAFDFLSTFENSLKLVCSEYAILAILPEPSITFNMVKGISWFVRLFKGLRDKGVPSARWKAENTNVWPDENQMKVARAQDLDEPLFVYNLNKYRSVAEYKKNQRIWQKG